MSQHFTDFSEYTTSAQPSDWTEFWNTTSAFTVRNDAGFTGGKYLEVTELSAFNRTGLSWDDVSGLDADEEILVKFNTSTAGILLLALRASGTLESARTGYVALVRNDTNALDIRKAVSGTETSLGTASFTMNNDTFYWVRFRVQGSAIKLRIWADGNSEPATWNQEYTNSDITSAGRIQVGTTGNTSANFKVDIVGVGLGGDSAPSEAPSAGGPWYNSSWTKRVKVTVKASEVDSDLSNFPVYVDLSLLPTEFHTNVKSDGGDIRVTTSDAETEVPREVVFYDSGTDTGELHFKAPSLSSSVDTDFYIYYGNASASDLAVGDTNGRNAVWSDYKAVYHMNEDPTGTVIDSTGNTPLNANVDLDSADLTTGKLGSGIKKDTTEYFRNSTGISFSAGQHISFQAWLKPTSWGSGANPGIWRAGDTSTGTQAFNILQGTTGRPWVRIAGTDVLKPLSGYQISLNVWTMVHYAIISSTSAKFYANGSLEHSTTHAIATLACVINNIGFQYTLTEELIGTYDEVRFRASDTTQEWVSAEYVNQSAPATFFTIGSEETYSPTSGGSMVKVWNGSAFVEKPLKVWNGTAWVDATLKRYNGATWDTI